MDKYQLMLTRCDRCGAEAKRCYKRPDGTLEMRFCEHHAQESNEALESQGWTCLDPDMVSA